jgi:hypothetical protein
MYFTVQDNQSKYWQEYSNNFISISQASCSFLWGDYPRFVRFHPLQLFGGEGNTAVV